MSPATISSSSNTLNRDISFPASMPVTAATSSPSAASSTADLTHIQTRPSRPSSSNSPSGSSSSASITSANATKSSKRNKAPPVFHFFAGLCTGALSAVLLQPADLLKTRVQQTRGTSVAGALRSILSQPGAVRQLWRGTLPSVIRTGFGSALYFASLNALRASWAGSGTQAKSGDGNGAGIEGTAVQDGGRRPNRRSMGEELSQVASLTGGNAREWTGERAGEEGRYLVKSAAAVTSNAADDDGPAPALDSTVSVHTPPSIPSISISTSTSSASSSSALVKLGNTANLVTGALARGGAGLVMMPITVLKVRYESSLYNSAYAGTSRGLVGAMQTIVSREGVRGLYAGYGATLVRDAPYAGLYVLFYEQAKSLLARVTLTNNGNDGSNNGGGNGSSGLAAARVNFLAGCGAAAAATAVTNPFDAIKTRIQLMPGRYANTLAAARTMLRHEGPRALFDGLGLRMARKAMSSALAWTLYEDLVRRAEIRYASVAEAQA